MTRLPDDLRTAIARENFQWDGTTRAYWGELDWEDVPESTRERHLEHADAILALLPECPL